MMMTMYGRCLGILASSSGVVGLKRSMSSSRVRRVVALDVADAGLGEDFVALVHLFAGPFQHAGGAAGVVDDGAHEVRDVLERGHFHDFGVDEDQLHHVRPLLVHDGHDDGVDADRFARAGGAGDQAVGHGGQVGDERLAAGVLAEEERDGLLASSRRGRAASAP